MTRTDLLIVGAGPFGLAMAREADRRGIEHTIVGRPMSFWREQMPSGMFLRSGVSWHLDPAEELTMEAWIRDRGIDRDALLPLALDHYLAYVAWYRDRAGIEVEARRVVKLSQREDGEFEATMEPGDAIVARRVLMAVGFQSFHHRPAELDRIFPAERCHHTRDYVDMTRSRDRRILIVGGRQSAFEWAALMCEAGARAVHLVHRHRSPAFAESDWSWVPELVGRVEDHPGWFRSLPESRRQEIDRRFWEQGRLRIEPWLEARLDREVVRIWQGDRVTGCEVDAAGTLRVSLASGRSLEVDDVVLATGYRVDIRRIAWLDPELLRQIDLNDGFPALDTAMQSSVPGLYFTSMAAARDFGPFMGFTVSVAGMTRLLGRAMAERD